MRPYILRRLALAVPTLALVSVIVFSMMRFMPGDVVIRMVEGHAYAPTIEALRKELGLDRPVYVQYFKWMGLIVQGNFGMSMEWRRPVTEVIGERLWLTVVVSVIVVLMSQMLW